MTSLFNRLAPFIQDYIFSQGWSELRQVQTEACRVIFETDAHLLLAAGTASGKTEAAFLPILTLLQENPSSNLGILYISPIKALINDQFQRLNELLQHTDTPVCAWHGDISQSRKRKLLQDPRGILQITPESLESLLINKQAELPRLFGDLRFIVIDEIHAFMGTQRGSQVLCQLSRLASRCNHSPRRIGLSATLGDYELAEQWLQSGTSLPVITPQILGGEQQVRLAIEHFFLHEEKEGEKVSNSISPHYQYIFDLSQGSKCLIFANNRTETEAVIGNLRHLAQQKRLPDIYHVHHGSISAILRERAEFAMREDTAAVTAATLTLELGIDIGQLERVIQLNAPFSVASFLQRLGRTGRRDEPADMRFVCTEPELTGEDSLGEQIPWQLLQAIAVIQLYREERWIEPLESGKYPFSLLYHQTLSILAARGELSPAALAEKVLTLPPFQAISQEDFRQLLRYLIEIDHLEKTEKGRLIIGMKGEKIVRNFRFYAVFADVPEYTVQGESGKIGSIAFSPPLGSRFALAGKTWEVIDIDEKRRTLFVQPGKGIASIFWRSGKEVNINTKILQKMRQILFNTEDYPYLLSGAKQRLQSARQLAKDEGLEKDNLISLNEKTACLFPWIGSLRYRTLERYLNLFGREVVDIRSITGQAPYFMTIKLGKNQLSILESFLTSLNEKDLQVEDLVASPEAPRLQKYDNFIPNPLLRKAFIYDYLEVP